MPTITVGTDQVGISYIDSGKPSHKGIYTTLLIVHGFCWNGGVFRKVIERAPAHGIRALAINRRGYKDSSLFTCEELAPLEATTRTPKDTRTFMRGQAVQLAAFLQQLADDNTISAPIGGTGGVVLLGWSLGNTFVCDFLSHVSALPEDLSRLVKKFVRAFIMFDPSFEAISLPPPAPVHLFWVQHVMQRHVSPQNAFTAMADFVSGWFEYPPMPAKRSKDISSWSDTERIERYVSTADHPFRPSTRVAEIGDPTFRACNEPSAASSDITIMTPVYTGEFRDITDAALFKDPGTAFWKGMRVEYVYCVNSFWPCVYAGEAVRCRFEGVGDGRKVKAIERANHFLPWTEPDRFLTEIMSLL